VLQKIFYTSVLVSDQDKALDVYTNVLGLEKRVGHDRDRRLPQDGRGVEVARRRVRLGRARVPVGLPRSSRTPTATGYRSDRAASPQDAFALIALGASEIDTSDSARASTCSCCAAHISRSAEHPLRAEARSLAFAAASGDASRISQRGASLQVAARSPTRGRKDRPRVPPASHAPRRLGSSAWRRPRRLRR
jgi:catechol 2,3-dioxygenase-like lactoylglutathione lyase family enzyme